jgi:hypothetical protein
MVEEGDGALERRVQPPPLPTHPRPLPANCAAICLLQLLAVVYYAQLYGGPRRSREERERQRQAANELLGGAAVAVGLVGAGVAAVKCSAYLGGWVKDRKEDWSRASLPIEEQYVSCRAVVCNSNPRVLHTD